MFPGQLRNRTSHFLLIIGDGLIVLLFLSAYFARYVKPDHFWWLQLFAVGLPYFSLAVLIAIPLLVKSRKWIFLGVHLFLVLLAFSRFDLFGKASAEPHSKEDSMSILTFNLRFYAPQDDDGKLLDFTRRLSPDLLAFQEASVEFHDEAPRFTGRTAIIQLIDSLGYKTRGGSESGEAYTHVPVLSKNALVSFEQFELKYDDRDAIPSKISRSTVMYKGKTVVLYNLHLRTFGQKKPWHEGQIRMLQPKVWLRYFRQYERAIKIRAWEATQVRKMIETEQAPLLVVGDFNSTPDTWVYSQLSKNLRDAFVLAGHGWGATFHSLLPLVRIDHVLVSPDWEVLEAQVFNDTLSDHRPLFARLKMK